MTLAEASAKFLDHLSSNKPARALSRQETLSLLASYFSSETTLGAITDASLRDFLARWYVEKACSSGSSKSDDVPAPVELLDSLEEFFIWADLSDLTDITAEYSPILNEFRQRLPRALELTHELSRWVRERRGAFSFPEFLTSFEQGGRSQYDIDTPGDTGALEGYFRIIRVEGPLVEAEELISEEKIWPVRFPVEIAERLEGQYIINLELVRGPEGWEIVDCGVAYPPGTEILKGD